MQSGIFYFWLAEKAAMSSAGEGGNPKNASKGALRVWFVCQTRARKVGVVSAAGVPQALRIEL